MPGGAISCTQALPGNLLTMFEAKPPLEKKLPTIKNINPPYTGMASYVQHFTPSAEVRGSCPRNKMLSL